MNVNSANPGADESPVQTYVNRVAAAIKAATRIAQMTAAVTLLSGCVVAPRYIVDEFIPGDPEVSEYEAHAERADK